MESAKSTYMEGPRRFAPALTNDLCGQYLKGKTAQTIRHSGLTANNNKKPPKPLKNTVRGDLLGRGGP